MKQKIYAIRDTKGECFNQPFFQRTHGEAERSFARLAQDDNSMVGKYPDDYDLYWIGEYDQLTGLITAEKSPQHIAKAAMIPDVVKRRNAVLNGSHELKTTPLREAELPINR